MTCGVCLANLKAGDLFCSSCGAAAPDQPATLHAATVEARGRIAGERKYLTVLCVDLQRSTDLISNLDPEEAIGRLEPALVAMRTAVRRNRGIVSKEGGDGLIALFGAPHADDNHALMACHAAVELVRRIKLLNDPDLHVRVGLHSGYVVAHTIEADLSSIYEAGGPAVHLVKRFENAAQAGQILVSESCQSLATGLVTFKRLPPRRMEGFPAPVPCYELVEISGLTRWRARSTKGLSAFVGRTEETSQLERAARDVRSSGEILALVGTAGVGKSRVAHEFGEGLRQQDWHVLEAECNPLEQNVPFALLKKLLQAVLRERGLTPEQAAAGGDSAHADLWPTAIRSVLDQLVADPRWNALEPLLRRRIIIEAACHMIGKAISQPTLLLLEDMHWIDSQSEAAVEALISMAAGLPLLMLLTWRTEDAPGWLSKLDVRRIWLRSLDTDSANALLDSLLGQGEALAALKGRVLRHTGQIPLFIEEVARQLIGRGIAGPHAGRFTETAQWEALEIPPTVQGVIASRIDRLPREDKALLQLASVAGARVSPQLLAAVTGMPPAQLQSRLWSLEILDFLKESQPDYLFAHDLVREVAYDSILRSQREVLHRRILTALEASGANPEDIAELLCRHAASAQEWGKADRYGHLAARKAFARSAFSDATEYFRIAMDAVDKQSESTLREQHAVDLRLEARQAFLALGRTEDWLSLGREGEERSKKIGDEGRRVASMAIRAAALNFSGTPYDAIAVGQEAVELANRLDRTTWLSFMEYGLGQSYYMAGRYEEGKRVLSSAIERLIAAPDEIPPGTTGANIILLCQMMKGLVCAWLGEFDEAEFCTKAAMVLAETSSRPYDLIAANYGRGVFLTMRGDLEDAELALHEALRVSRESEVRIFLPLVMSALGSLLSQRGEIRPALEILLQTKKEAEALGHETSKVALPAYLASVYSQLGDVDQALSLARACQAGAKQKGYLGIEGFAALTEANILISARWSNADEISDCLTRAAEIATRLGAQPLLGATMGVRARHLVARGLIAEARDELAKAVSLFDRSKMTTHLQRAKVELSKFSDT